MQNLSDRDTGVMQLKTDCAKEFMMNIQETELIKRDDGGFSMTPRLVVKGAGDKLKGLS